MVFEPVWVGAVRRPLNDAVFCEPPERGWEEIADFALDWAVKHAPAQPATAGLRNEAALS